MGVKNFYYSFREKFKNAITRSIQYEHDVLIIELNGLFYSATKKIYEFMNSYQYQKDKNNINILLYEEICENLYKIIIRYLPRKKILLVVDGVPGMMKNIEQRQRRFKNSLESKYRGFDLNSFSPGTKLLTHLTKYVDWYLRKKINCDERLQKLSVYFSNEKVIGEGEIKILKFIHKELTKTDKILIYNCDSDLILLSIFSEYHIIICRNSVIYGQEFINIETCKEQLINYLKWDNCNKRKLLSDAMLLFFLLGNDYINSSPSVFSLDILYNYIFPLYKLNKKHFVDNDYILKLLNICNFFQKLSLYEEEWYIKKIKNQKSFFYEDIYMNSLTKDYKLNFKKFQEIYKHEMVEINEKSYVLYLKTMQNYINMFTLKGIKWDFHYYYNHTPFLKDFIYTKSLQDDFDKFLIKEDIYPFNSYIHLLTILPPQSQNLLPTPLQSVFTDKKEYFSSKIEFNLCGKKNIWESPITNLKPIELDDFIDYYNSKNEKLSDIEKKRLLEGKTFKYSYSIYNRDFFQSYYGEIVDCNVICKYIIL